MSLSTGIGALGDSDVDPTSSDQTQASRELSWGKGNMTPPYSYNGSGMQFEGLASRVDSCEEFKQLRRELVALVSSTRSQ